MATDKRIELDIAYRERYGQKIYLKNEKQLSE